MANEPLRSRFRAAVRRHSRLAAWTLTGVAALLVYVVLLHGWFTVPMLRIHHQLDHLRAVHARYAAALAQEPQLQHHLDAVEHSQAVRRAFLPWEDRNTAAAHMIRRVTRSVDAHAQLGTGCHVRSRSPVQPVARQEDPVHIDIRLSLDCGIEPLAAVLHDFRNATPFLFVHQMTLARADGGRLRANFILTGYVRPSAP